MTIAMTRQLAVPGLGGSGLCVSRSLLIVYDLRIAAMGLAGMVIFLILAAENFNDLVDLFLRVLSVPDLINSLLNNPDGLQEVIIVICMVANGNGGIKERRFLTIE